MSILDRLERIQISSFEEARRRIQIFKQILLALSIVVIIYSYVAYADGVSDKMYSVVQSNHYCSRRLNATHQMGCTSKLGGNQGIVWIVKNQMDLDHILKTGPTPPYVAVLYRDFYSRKNLLDFKANPHRVSGVIFIYSDNSNQRIKATPFSPDDRCPNRYSGLYVNDSQYRDCNQNIWQKESPISGLLYDDIPFPIFLINEEKSINTIEACFNDNNIAADKSQRHYPLCGIHLDSFMMAAQDSETCLNSHSFVDDLLQSNGRRCYPVDNQNVFAYLKPTSGPLQPMNKTNFMKPDVVEPQSIVMLIAKLSSISMFTEVSPGADSTITSIITLLAVADALGKARSNPEVVNSKRNVAFAILDSEPFDYTGSTRMVRDMLENQFPNYYFKSRPNITDAIQNMNLTSIDLVINLDQLSLYPETDTIHLHSGPQGANSPKLESTIDIIKRIAMKESVKLEQEEASLPLPPTPVHEFIKQSRSLPEDQRLLGIVISNYGKTFNNMYYHGVYDNFHNVYHRSKDNLTIHLTRVSNMIAKSLYELTFKTEATNLEVDGSIIDQLLSCYLKDASCPLFTKAWQASQQLPKGPIQTYKDPIKKSDDMNGAITAHMLSYFIGDKVPNYNLTECFEENKNSPIYNFQYVNGEEEPTKDMNSGICIKSQVQMLTSTSPAFVREDNGIAIDPKYPAWTVSLNSIRNPVRLYLKPSPVYEWGVFLIGISITWMAFLVVSNISKSISATSPDSESSPSTST